VFERECARVCERELSRCGPIMWSEQYVDDECNFLDEVCIHAQKLCDASRTHACNRQGGDHPRMNVCTVQTWGTKGHESAILAKF
jgi:hypothetical protein